MAAAEAVAAAGALYQHQRAKKPKQSPSSPFPNVGVSLAFLQAFLRDPRMAQPMAFLLRPDLDDAQLEEMDPPDLRALRRRRGRIPSSMATRSSRTTPTRR